MKNNSGLILGLLALAGLGFFLYKKEEKNTNLLPVEEGDADETPVLQQQNNLLDGNKILQIGVNGIEVKELQRLLGISADGVFGLQTKTSLLNRKGVDKITLNKWITTPNITSNVTIKYKYKKGDKLIVNNASGVKFPVYNKNPFANIFTNTNQLEAFSNNEIIGRVVELRKSPSNKPLYMIEEDTIFTPEYYLVSELYVR